ncbi:MAG: hypothetical protein AB7L09_00865 [Nitrospira sp.]
MVDKKANKKCRTDGFAADCVKCGKAFLAVTHVAPKCGGGFQEHDDHDDRDCCGYGDHKERRDGLTCADCVFKQNMIALA